MNKYTNTTGLPLSMAVFLATDHYDHDDSTISATALLKPVRQLILTERVPKGDSVVDVQNLVASRLGTAIHDGIEKAWVSNYEQALADLGVPKSVINRVRLNPTDEALVADPDIIPIYMEQRVHREFKGFKISGKFDFIAEGIVEDFKSTGVYTYINNTKDEDHAMQGGIYRWLAPQWITSDRMRIDYIFMDWQAVRAKTENGYPPQRVLAKNLDLPSIEETEAFIANKLALYVEYKDAPEEDIPLCSDKDLWRSKPAWKYYKNPAKQARSTKNFDNKHDAYIRLHEDNDVGIVVENPGEVRACKYCPAFSVCTQKDALVLDGSLKL